MNVSELHPSITTATSTPGTLVDATNAYQRHIEGGGRMMVTLAGAMSTAELGLSLAEMIRRDLVHAITCTGANLEEDLFNLVAHDHYVRVPDWRNLTPQQEKDCSEPRAEPGDRHVHPRGEAFRALEGRCFAVAGGGRGRRATASRTSTSTG